MYAFRTARSDPPPSLAMVDRRLLPAGDPQPDIADAIRRATGEALEYAGVGLLLTDRTAHVRFVNTVAEPLLHGPYLRLRLGRLGGATTADTAQLHVAIATATAPGREAAQLVVLQGRGEPEALHITTAPLRPLGDTASAVPLAMIVISMADPAVDESRLRQAFSLTTAEARLLSALVDGERLAAYAARTGIKLTTAKTHLGSLFEKVGETRQADLIRRAMTDPLLRRQMGRTRGG